MCTRLLNPPFLSHLLPHDRRWTVHEGKLLCEVNLDIFGRGEYNFRWVSLIEHPELVYRLSPKHKSPTPGGAEEDVEGSGDGLDKVQDVDKTSSLFLIGKKPGK